MLSFQRDQPSIEQSPSFTKAVAELLVSVVVLVLVSVLVAVLVKLRQGTTAKLAWLASKLATATALGKLAAAATELDRLAAVVKEAGI